MRSIRALPGALHTHLHADARGGGQLELRGREVLVDEEVGARVPRAVRGEDAVARAHAGDVLQGGRRHLRGNGQPSDGEMRLSWDALGRKDPLFFCVGDSGEAKYDALVRLLEFDRRAREKGDEGPSNEYRLK